MKNSTVVRSFVLGITFCFGAFSCNYFKSPLEKWHHSIIKQTEVNNNFFKIQLMKIDFNNNEPDEIGFRVRIVPILKQDEHDQSMLNLNNNNFIIEHQKSIFQPDYTQYISNGSKLNYEYLILFNRSDLAFKKGLQFKLALTDNFFQNLTISIN